MARTPIRRIPLAVAATLTFGGGCDDKDTTTLNDGTDGGEPTVDGGVPSTTGDAGPATTEADSGVPSVKPDSGTPPESGADAYIRAICETYVRCDPEALTTYHTDFEGCEAEFQEYYVDEYVDWGSQADDPEACLAAVDDWYGCFGELYTNMSCEVFNELEEQAPGCEDFEAPLESACVGAN